MSAKMTYEELAIKVQQLEKNEAGHKRTKEALILSRQKLDLHFLQTPLAVIEWDLDFKVQSWNPAAEKTLGYTKQEMLGKPASLITLESDRPHIDKIWEQLLKQKGGTRSTNKNITKKGEIILCEWFNTPIVDKTGKTISVFSLAQDITRRKQAEETIQLERDKLQSVINGIGENLYIVNKNYIIEFQDNISVGYFGDLLGKHCYESIFNQSEPCNFCRMQECMNDKQVRNVETDIINGKCYDIFFSPFIDSNKDIKSINILRDITEKKSLQTEAMRAGHLASIGELAAGVAHEINNPITSIIMMAELIADEYIELGGDKTIPEKIIAEGERISAIVKNLLSFARDRKEDFIPSNIIDIVNLSLDLVKKQIFNDGIKLSVDIPPDIPKIKMNSQEIQQVVLNLVSNARYALKKKYPDPHVNKTIEIKSRLIDIKERKYVRTTFFDKGIGVPKKNLKSIISPFFSTKPENEGTGLGLSLTHGILKNHGGQIEIDSIEGEYTKIIIDLPAYQSPQRR